MCKYSAFIINTANDYDLNVEIVQNIYDNYPDLEFYEQLEYYIKNKSFD